MIVRDINGLSKEKLLKYVELTGGYCFVKLSNSLRKDRDVICKALSVNGLLFRLLDDKDKADDEYMSLALKNNINCFSFFLDEFKSCKRYVCMVVKGNAEFIVDLSYELKRDLDVVGSALQSPFCKNALFCDDVLGLMDEYGVSSLKSAVDLAIDVRNSREEANVLRDSILVKGSKVSNVETRSVAVRGKGNRL